MRKTALVAAVALTAAFSMSQANAAGAEQMANPNQATLHFVGDAMSPYQTTSKPMAAKKPMRHHHMAKKSGKKMGKKS